MRKRKPMCREVRRAIFKEFGNTCVFCRKEGLKMSSKDHTKLGAVDHIVPVKKGGTDDWHNLQLLCTPCNARKRDKSMSEFVEYMRKREESDEMAAYLVDEIPGLAEVMPHFLERYPSDNRYELLKPIYERMVDLADSNAIVNERMTYIER